MRKSNFWIIGFPKWKTTPNAERQNATWTHLRNCLNPYFITQQELNDICINEEEFKPKCILVKTIELLEKKYRTSNDSDSKFLKRTEAKKINEIIP